MQGSSKSGFVGEASIDFSDFEAETEPMTVSLPLKFANSGAILHVGSLSISRPFELYLAIRSLIKLPYHCFSYMLMFLILMDTDETGYHSQDGRG